MANIGGLTECQRGTPVLDPRAALQTHNVHSNSGRGGVPALAAAPLSLSVKFGSANDSCSGNVGNLNWR